MSYQRYLFRIVYFAIIDNYSCFNEETLSIFAKLIERPEFKDVTKLVVDNMSLEIINKLKLDLPEQLKINIGIPKQEFFMEMDKLWKTQW